MKFKSEMSDGIVCTTIEGILDFNCVCQLLGLLFEKRAHRGSRWFLVDCSQVERIDLGKEEFISISGYSKVVNQLYGRSTVAVVAPGDPVFGVCRMYQIVSELYGSMTEIGVFRTKKSGLDFFKPLPARRDGTGARERLDAAV